MQKIVVNKKVYNRIKEFYNGARLKYPNTYSFDDAARDNDRVCGELYKVGSQLLKKNSSIIKKWKDYLVDYSKATGWYFAYFIEENIIYIEDTENYRNMDDLANKL